MPTPFRLGRHSVSGNSLLRFDGVNDSLFTCRLIVFFYTLYLPHGVVVSKEKIAPPYGGALSANITQYPILIPWCLLQHSDSALGESEIASICVV